MKFLSFLFLIFCSLFSFSQNVGIGTNTPDSSAALEIKSTSQGFLPPRLTNIQRNAIANPAEGLQIFNTTSAIPEVYSNGEWRPFGTTNNNYFTDNINDLDGYIQSDSLDYSCILSDTKRLEIMDFACDSIGNQIYFLKYIGKQFFYGQQFDCIDGNERYVLMKLNASGNLIWKQDLNLTFAEISFAKIGLLTDGNIVLALTHYIGIGIATQYTYSIGGRSFSFNNYYTNIIKLNSNGQYLYNKTFLNISFSFFDVNNNNVAGYIYRNINSNTVSYSFIVEMLNCNSSTLSRIWQYTSPSSSNVDFISVGIHPTENSIFYTYVSTYITTITLKLAKFINSSSVNLISLGSVTTSWQGNYGQFNQMGISFINNNIQVNTPTKWSITFNNQIYNGLLHLTLSSLDYTLSNVFEENTNKNLSKIKIRKCGSSIVEILVTANYSSLTYETGYEYLFNIFNEDGNLQYSTSNQIVNGNDPIEFISFCTSRNKLIVAGNSYNSISDLKFLNFSLIQRNNNRINPFVFYLNLPN